MSDYDWNKIISNKSDKELFKIIRGKDKHYPTIAREKAKEAAINRGYDPEKIHLYQSMWVLKRLELIQSKYNTFSHFFISYNKFFSLFLVAIGMEILVSSYIDYQNSTPLTTDDKGHLLAFSFFILLSLMFLSYGLITFFMRQYRTKQRKEKVHELTQLLKDANLKMPNKT